MFTEQDAVCAAPSLSRRSAGFGGVAMISLVCHIESNITTSFFFSSVDRITLMDFMNLPVGA